MKKSVPFEPLVLYAYGSILHIFNVSKKGFAGYQRAHGGVSLVEFVLFGDAEKYCIGYNVHRSPPNDSILLRYDLTRPYNANLRLAMSGNSRNTSWEHTEKERVQS